MEENLNYILRAKKYKAKKSLGQNFLIDKKTIDFIIQCAGSDDEVLEIGAGLGFVTEELIKKTKKTIALEIDKDAINLLNKNLSDNNNFFLFEKDILKTDIDDLPFDDKKIKVIANIPYYITSPIISHLLGEIDDKNNKNRKRIKEIILMVQLEVAKRIIANEKSSNKEYGLLSILAQMYCEVEIIKIVPKTSFIPSPKVDSAIVRFRINDKPKVEIGRLFKKTAKALFNLRRKNIKNSLIMAGFKGVEEVLLRIGLDKNIRGEKLSIYDIQKLASMLEEFNR